MLRLKQFINVLQMSKLHKRKFFSIKLLPRVKPLLIILVKLNIINFIKIKENGYHLIFPNLNNKLKLVPMGKKSNKFISYKNIEQIILKKKWTAIISTSKGLKTTKECIRERLGGILVFNVMCAE